MIDPAESTTRFTADVAGPLSETRDPSAPILFYDGTCGLCNGMVRFVLGHERLHTLRFAMLQGPKGDELIGRYPQLHDVDSVVWLTPGSGQARERVYVRSDAALRVARYLGGFWRVALLAVVVPRRLRDAAYDFVAKHRHRLTRGPAFCRVLDAKERARFLD